MRETSSIHVVSTTAPSNQQSWEPDAAKTFLPTINLGYLSKILQNATLSEKSFNVINGKRKALTSVQPTRRTKRTRTSEGSIDDIDHSLSDESSNCSDEDEDDSEDYFVLGLQHNTYRQPDERLVPILRHVLEIQYIKSEGPAMHSKKWNNEDKEFQAILSTLVNFSSSSNTIDLGDIRFAEHRGSAVAVPYNPHRQNEPSTWLFIVPSLVIDRESNDLGSSSSNDLLLACHTLQGFGQAYVEASLRLVVLPLSMVDTFKGQLPFMLQLEFVVSLVLPLALDPPSSRRAQLLAREDAQRRLLRATYLSQDITSMAINEEVTVSTLYSILGSPPPLPSARADKALQPESLVPTLLPFQRRSVAWMLEKEGMVVNEEGLIVPQKLPDNFSFWKEIKEGVHTWYLNRLSGELSADPPNIIPVPLGGILAEEPGLGKTVETIALILLNPAPPEYNPTLTRWDPQASLEVKAVKTTLIVTPPSLAGQWKEEFEKHAPSLNILMYDGWSKVKVPITKRQVDLKQPKNVGQVDAPKPTKTKLKGKAAAVNGGGMDVDLDGDTSVPDSTDDKNSGSVVEWPEFVHGYDVVITTYQALRSDLYVAHPDPKRPRRTAVVYERPRSPLVMVEWKRVVMDEVQMVGGGKAEEMVSLIPRLSSFAVSGTPAKTQPADLIHVLRFLRVDKIVGGPRLWKRLLKPGFVEEFAEFLQRYAIRTIKSNVAGELTIPRQTRYLVPIELGKVEGHVYDQTLESILQVLGLDARGVACSSGWRVDSNLLRSSIRRLRGMCTHPQVGTLQKKGDNLYKPGALKTMSAVLETMRDQNWRNFMEEWKIKIQSLVRHSQLQQQDETNMNRYKDALETLNLVEKDTQKYLEEIQTTLADHDAKGKDMKAEATRLRQAPARVLSPDVTPAQKGKGKEQERFSEDENDSEGEDALSDPNDGVDDPEEKDLPKTPAGEEHRIKRRAIKARLREGQLVLHRVKFLQGNVYHVLGKSVEEDAAYQAAEALRHKLLKATEIEANKAIAILGSNATKKCLSHAETLIELPILQVKGGIRSADLIEELDTLIEDVLNQQADLLWEWRERIMVLLSRPLAQKEDEVDGQEYQRTLDDQDEAETYLQAYAALLADRRVALINERTLLAAHDVRAKHFRQTKAAFKAAHKSVESESEIPNGLDIQPEHEALHKDLSNKRKDVLVKLGGRAIKSILVDLNVAAAKILQNTHPEKIIIKQAIEGIRGFMSDQTALQDKLDGDLALLRRAFNQRILYFRQLQEISDSVTDVEWEEATIAMALEASSTERMSLETKMNTTRARQRYLDTLVNDHDDLHSEQDDRACILCRCDFTRGYITQCAHVFCEGCMRTWLLRKEGKTCPVCRVTVKPDTVQRFTVNAVNSAPPPQPKRGEPAPQSRRIITYNVIDPSIFSDIQSMETYGEYGSKIQTLVRHLLYVKLTDAGAKSIVFSAWADSLHIVEWALKENGIRCLRIDQKSKNESAANVFRTNPDILVLLLHGERENTGLNLTCASRVFLLESVVQHSFEIQAIARIDRLGQTRPTEVYCYYAEDTIERNILDLAARKGLSLYTKENSSGSLNLSSFSKDNETAIDNPEKRKALQRGDFIHKVDDMLAILFPHMFEEVEYLVPPDITDCDVEMTDFDVPRRIMTGVEVNAIAGPSRA